MVEILEDSREVWKEKDGMHTIVIHQKQRYEPEVAENMINSWKEKLASIEEWLSKFDEHVAEGQKRVKEELELQKVKLEREVTNLKEGIELWSNVREVTDTEGY